MAVLHIFSFQPWQGLFSSCPWNGFHFVPGVFVWTGGKGGQRARAGGSQLHFHDLG